MKERPILFSAPMVRALLSGTKTQTRRIVKPPRNIVSLYRPFPNEPENVHGVDADGLIGWYAVPAACPYGQPGDRLWVRETFCLSESAPYADGKSDAKPLYRADFKPEDDQPWYWKPSIFMPRWASRITLEVVSVRVERLQDISEADAVAEGCTDPDKRTIAPRTICHASARTEYMALWEKINGGGSWAANPWVWVVEFKKCVHTSKGAATP